MTEHPRGTESPVEISTEPEQRDAKILREAVREAIRTSPGSFLKTVEDVDAKAQDYWIYEIQSSTWIVAEWGEEIVGVAAAKRPDPDKDSEDGATTRYIESIWIAPNLRHRGRGHELIGHLLEAEYRKNPLVRRFLLWVFTTNSSAIRLYKHMGFVSTGEENKGFRPEIKYRLDFDDQVYLAVRLAVNDAARRLDKQQYEVTYRVLGNKDST
jgi:ribosomal protein S18 acetylase RimI-like enzyme